MITSKKILGALLGAMLMSVVLVAIPTSLGENVNSSDTSISIDGWNFTLTDPVWRCNDDKMFRMYDSEDKRYVFPMSSPNAHWTGYSVLFPFYYPAFPKAPVGNKYYDTGTAQVENIIVLDIPDDFRRDIEDYNIAIYGSPEKVPAEVKKKETEQILKDAIRNYALGWYVDERTKYDDGIFTTVDGHKAYLRTGKNDDNVFSVAASYAAAAVMLDNYHVGVIYVVVDKTGSEGGTLYKGNAKDVINAFTFERETV
ncbi:MAG TPA: hypothetical protein P5244_15330 [Syntrophales bacterium]|jgi:hypothetical protein|nr:hypothetical protein [Syntrophales bacterium]